MLMLVEDHVIILELWTSLVSLIQSYVAGHEFGKPSGQSATLTSKDGRLSIASGDRTLAIECITDCDDTGLGEWRLFRGDVALRLILSKGSFRLGTDSVVEFSDRKGKLELDVAAEAFTAKIFDEE